MRTKASILVGLLWCLTLLSVVVISVLHSARLDLLVVKNHGDSIQAHYLALAGIEQTKALLYQDAMERRRSAVNHNGQLYNAPRYFREVPFGRGHFRVIRPGNADEGGQLIYGVADEESRLNLNSVSAEELQKIEHMTPDLIAAITDWRDGDHEASPGGAEADYYVSMQPPYLPRNGRFQTPREFLMVRGASRDLFLGEDANQNGLLDPEEDDGNESYPADNQDGLLNAGWSELFAVDSITENVNAAGDERVNVQSADESTLTGIRGITTDMAKAIVAHRNGNRLESLDDLLEVQRVREEGARNAPPPQNAGSAENRSRTDTSAPPGNASSSNRSGNNPPATTGERLISESLLMDIADDVTVADGGELTGLVNINTASLTVLSCLPGLDLQSAQAIINYRQSSGFFPNVAWLLKVPGIHRQIFKQLAPRVTTRSETYRILCEGKIGSTGARKRLQVVIHVGASTIDTLAYREDL